MDPTISTLTDGQEIALSILSIVSGTLSILGSSIIVYKVSRNPLKAGPYDRIMLALSSCDIIASFSFAVAPFLLPQETSQRVWALGNEASCTFLGWLFQFSFAAIAYNGFLSFYYLFTVRLGMSRKKFARRFELCGHISLLLFFLTTATVGAALGVYGEVELGQGCWVDDYPKGCVENGGCISSYIGWGFAAIPTLITFGALVANNVVIYVYVRRNLQPRQPNLVDSGRDEIQRAHIREVASQGFLYVITFFVAYLPAFVLRILESMWFMPEDEARLYPLLALSAFLLPLQGLFNMLVYTRPNYTRFRAAYPELSTMQVARMACLNKEIPRLSAATSFHTTRSKTATNNKQRKTESRNQRTGSAATPSTANRRSLDVLLEGEEHNGYPEQGCARNRQVEDGDLSSTASLSYADALDAIRKTPDEYFMDAIDANRKISPREREDTEIDDSREIELTKEIFRAAATSLKRMGMDGAIDECTP